MVVGDLLANGRSSQLDLRAMDHGWIADARLVARASRRTSLSYLLVIFLRSALGTWWPDVWFNYALPRPVAWHGGGPRIYSGLRHACSAHISWSVHAVAHATLRRHHSDWRGNLCPGNSVCGSRRHLE